MRFLLIRSETPFLRIQHDDDADDGDDGDDDDDDDWRRC